MQFTWFGEMAASCECGAEGCKGVLGRSAPPGLGGGGSDTEAEEGPEDMAASMELVFGTLIGSSFGLMRRRPEGW